jgi:hypothetical protein
MLNAGSILARLESCHHRFAQNAAIALLAILMNFASSGLAEASTQEMTYVIDSSDNPSFAALMQQAEGITADSIRQAFAADLSVTEVSVKIAADRNGNLSPLLVIKVSRADWQTQPNVQAWAHYLGDASVLLGYRQGQGSGSAIASSPSYTPAVSSGSFNSNSEPNFYN